MKRLLQVTALIFLVLVTVVSGSAQEGFAREDVRPFVRVTIGTRTDNYIYYTPEQPDYNRILAIINQALPIYETMTGQTWTTQIVIVYMGTGDNLSVSGRMMENSTAYVTRRDPPRLFPDAESCHIRIYSGWTSVPNLESLVAREFFTCMQMSMGVVTWDIMRDPANTWWRMGIAEWAASRVYPEQYPQLIHSLFDPRLDITRARLDAYYFWEFASTGRGFGSDQNVIAQMRDIQSFPINFSFGSLELFHNWAQVLLNRQLPNPPVVDLTTSDITAGRGGSLTTFTPRFAVDYKNLVAFDLKPGNIAFVKVSGIGDTFYAVSLRTAAGIQRLIEDEPFQFCPPDDGAMLIISRGLGTSSSPAPFTIEWGQSPSNTPCTEVPDEPDTGNCIVGSWGVLTYPYDLAGTFATIDVSGFIFNFDEDGAFDGTYVVHARNPDGVRIDLNFTFTGSYELGGIEGSSTDYAVQTFNWVFEQGGFAELTARNGTISDFTDAFYRNSDLRFWSPNGTLNCNGDSLSWGTTNASYFELERLP